MWKLIEESDGYYVSDDGQVKHNDVILKYRMTKNGYARVNIKIKDKFIDKYVHRLVAQYFIPNPNNYPAVNHIDGCKTNNFASNLEWCTYKMNMEHASTMGLINCESLKRKEQCKINQSRALEVIRKPSIEYDENGNYVKEHIDYGKFMYRLSYFGHYYFDKNVLLNLYGTIPLTINISHIQKLQNKQRHIYYEYRNNKIVKVYNKLRDLPISREMFYFHYKHHTLDENGSRWEAK